MEALAAVEVEVGFAVEGRVEVFPAVGVVWRSLGRWEVGVVGSLPNKRGSVKVNTALATIREQAGCSECA